MARESAPNEEVAQFVSFLRTQTTMPERDRVILYMLSVLGLTNTQIINLNRSDIDLGDRDLSIHVRSAIQVKNKVVRIARDDSNGVIFELLAEYLRDVRETDHQTLFVTRSGKPLVRSHISKLVEKYKRLAGVTNLRVYDMAKFQRKEGYTPQDFAGTDTLNDYRSHRGSSNRSLANKISRQTSSGEGENGGGLSPSHTDRRFRSFDVDNIIGRSAKIVQVLRMVEKVANYNIPIYIYGESGTGKELIAKAIHYSGNRKNGAFVSENCGAVAESLLESELFGHEKGAFTGANATKKGLFEVANKGSIFLDEVAEMSANMQKKLLRVLQENRIRRVGGTNEVFVDVRVISATNKNLIELVKAGKFREDLFYRLHVIKLELPPLRERKEDIPLLVNHFIKRYASEEITVDPRILDAMMRYKWEGNIRELENEVRKLIALRTGSTITYDQITDDPRFSAC